MERYVSVEGEGSQFVLRQSQRSVLKTLECDEFHRMEGARKRLWDNLGDVFHRFVLKCAHHLVDDYVILEIHRVESQRASRAPSSILLCRFEIR